MVLQQLAFRLFSIEQFVQHAEGSATHLLLRLIDDMHVFHEQIPAAKALEATDGDDLPSTGAQCPQHAIDKVIRA